MGYRDDPEGYRLRLEAKLAPARIRSTMAFAGLYQMTHEMIKQSVVDEVAAFHGRVELLGRGPESRPMYEWIGGDERFEHYKRSVLGLDRGVFQASLLWLVSSCAITREQADRLAAIYAHRHDLTHQLVKYIVDPDFEPELELLSDALTILRDLRRFWTGIERDIGSFERLGDVDLDEVVPMSLMVLQMCLDAYVDGLEK
jgi:hypothetical protein